MNINDLPQGSYKVVPQGTQGMLNINNLPKGSYTPGVFQPVQQQEEKKPGFIQSIAQGVASPFIKTIASAKGAVQGAIGLGEGAIQAMQGDKQGARQTINEAYRQVNQPINAGYFGSQLPAQNLRQGIGTGLQLGAYAVPVGGAAAGAATQIAKGALTGATAGLLGSAGSSLANSNPQEKSIQSLTNAEFSGIKGAGVGAVLGAVVPAAVNTVKYFASRIPKLLGIATGESSNTIEAALQNPKAADAGINNGDEALRNAVQVGQEKSQELRDSFINGYTNLRDSLPGFNEQLPNVNKGWMMKSFQDNLSKKGATILPDGNLDFTTSKIGANPGEVSSINRAYDAIKNWDDWSFKGVDDLKHLMGAYAKFQDAAGNPSKSAFLGSFYKTVDSTIKLNLPSDVSQAYGEMNKVFSDKIDFYNDLIDAFNKGDSFTRLANILGKNKDTLRQVINYYENQTGENVTSIVAGRELAAEKQAAFGFLNPRSWIDFFWSPKTQAKFVTGVGKMMGNANEITPTVSNMVESSLPTENITPFNATEQNLSDTLVKTNRLGSQEKVLSSKASKAAATQLKIKNPLKR